MPKSIGNIKQTKTKNWYIIVAPPLKGLTRTDYNTKVKNLLDDVSTYEVRTNDTTTKTQNKVNTLIKKWENKKLINNLLPEELRTSIAVLPDFMVYLKFTKWVIRLDPLSPMWVVPLINLLPFSVTPSQKTLHLHNPKLSTALN